MQIFDPHTEAYTNVNDRLYVHKRNKQHCTLEEPIISSADEPDSRYAMNCDVITMNFGQKEAFTSQSQFFRKVEQQDVMDSYEQTSQEETYVERRRKRHMN